MTNQQERWLNVQEAAAHLGVSVELMQVKMPSVPGARKTSGSRGHWRVKASMLDAWMEQQQQEKP